MAEKKLKWGIVGLGGIWNWGHSPDLLKHPEVEIAAVCDIVPKKVEKWTKELGAKGYTDFQQMIDDADLDVVDVCTPNLYHSKVAVAALKAGRHVFCEKPDAINPAEAQKMADAAKKSGKTLMVMRNNRFSPQAQWLKKFIDAGEMGEVYTGRCGWQRRRGIPGKGGWFTTKALSGGGPLIDLGVHFLDVAMWLMNDPIPVAVSGCTYRKFADMGEADSVHSKFGEAKANGTFDVEDLAIGFIRFANGASLQLEFSWASNIETENTFVELRGTKAGATLNAKDHPLKIFSENKAGTYDLVPKLHKFERSGHGMMLHHFVDVLQKRAKPIIKPETGVHMIKILDAVYRSAAQGKEVKL
jgi:predicted dehydrogenase